MVVLGSEGVDMMIGICEECNRNSSSCFNAWQSNEETRGGDDDSVETRFVVNVIVVP